MKKVVFLLLLVGGVCAAFVGKNEAEITSKSTHFVIKGEGIKFQDMSLEKAKDLAKSTGKLIFIDAYTSWCGPCKAMARDEFVKPDLGNLFNSKFINLKIDVEKDADGAELVRMYKVRAYPTLLFIDGDGKLIKSVSGYQYANDLIAIGNSL
jgi:thioredoxin 1